MKNLQDIVQEVEAAVTVPGGVQTLISGLEKQIAESLSSGITLASNVQSRIDTVFAEAKAAAEQIAVALTTNTEVAPPPAQPPASSK